MTGQSWRAAAPHRALQCVCAGCLPLPITMPPLCPPTRLTALQSFDTEPCASAQVWDDRMISHVPKSKLLADCSTDVPNLPAQSASLSLSLSLCISLYLGTHLCSHAHRDLCRWEQVHLPWVGSNQCNCSHGLPGSDATELPPVSLLALCLPLSLSLPVSFSVSLSLHRSG